jgi:hypothetical protein
MRLTIISMPIVAVCVVLAVSIQGKYYRGTEDFKAHPGSTAVWARKRRNEAAKEKQLPTRQRTKASPVVSTNR